MVRNLLTTENNDKILVNSRTLSEFNVWLFTTLMSYNSMSTIATIIDT